MSIQGNNIRVLIVDDSPTVRKLLQMILQEDERFEIAGVVSSGEEALSFCSGRKPDVISMDIHMPGMNGFEATRRIMMATPVPIVIVSSAYNPGETALSFKALEAGALTILPRPSGPGHPDFSRTAQQFRKTLQLMAEVKVIRRNGRPSVITTSLPAFPVNPAEIIVAIGASAGGPSAIQAIIQRIHPEFPLPVLLVQHIDKGFAEGYIDWLKGYAKVPVSMAKDGELILPGHVYLPPGDHHLGLRQKGVLSVNQSPPEEGLRPSVSHLFRDVRQYYGSKAIGIILSGMGKDGTGELASLKQNGAFTIVQSAHTALVNGMPGEAVSIGAATTILAPEQMVQAILTYIST